VEDPIRDFLIGFLALVIVIMLFVVHRRFPQADKFVHSMAILIPIMALVGLTVPLLVERPGYMYYFLPIYLIGLNGWLFFARYGIFDRDNWYEDISYEPVRRVWFILIGVFFPGAIALVVFIPHIPNFSLP